MSRMPRACISERAAHRHDRGTYPSQGRNFGRPLRRLSHAGDPNRRSSRFVRARAHLSVYIASCDRQIRHPKPVHFVSHRQVNVVGCRYFARLVRAFPLAPPIDLFLSSSIHAPKGNSKSGPASHYGKGVRSRAAYDQARPGRSSLKRRPHERARRRKR
jgi:hypothetical protein